MRIDWSITASFFDRPVVQKVRDAGRAILSRFGAFTMRDARQSIKTAPRVSADEQARYRIKLKLWAAGRIGRRPTDPNTYSPAGKPPFARRPKSPIKLILFAWDAREQSVTVGPVAFGKKPGEATEALEYGGASTNDGRRVNVAAHPTMHPAFDRNLPHLRRWRNAVA